MDRRFVLSAFGYAIIGLMLGIYMASSQNHEQLVTHAHIMLVGFVVSFIYGLCHKLWLDGGARGMGIVQFYLHQIGTLVMAVGLFLLYGKFSEPEKLEPFLAAASLAVFAALFIMAVMIVRTPKGT